MSGPLLTLIGIWGVVGLAFFVWYLWAMARLFPRIGLPASHGWIPIWNLWQLMNRTGLPGWVSLLVLVPGLGVVPFVFGVIAIHRINTEAGLGAGYTVLGAFIPPLWATLAANSFAETAPLRQPAGVGGSGGYGGTGGYGGSGGGYAAGPGAAAQAQQGYGAPPAPPAPAPAHALPPVPPQHLAPQQPAAQQPASQQPAPLPPQPSEQPARPAPLPWETVAEPAVFEEPTPTDRWGLSSTTEREFERLASEDLQAPPAAPLAPAPAPRPAAWSELAPPPAPEPAAAPAPEPAATSASQPPLPPAPPAPPTATGATGATAAPGAPSGAAQTPPVPPVHPAAVPQHTGPAASRHTTTSPPRHTGPAAPRRPAVPAAAEAPVSKQAEAPAPKPAEAPVPKRAEAPVERDDRAVHSEARRDPESAAPAPSSIDELFAREDDLDRTVVAARPPRQNWVLVLPDGEEIPLPGGDVVVGRKPQAVAGSTVLAIPDPTRTLSKSHARMRFDGESWTIEDLGSTNGLVLVAESGEEIEAVPGQAVLATEQMIIGTLEVALRRAGDAR
ncbi:FHA domain-containing protein [Leucobacter sp. CSA1]|uniref:FHA domain-containing protein n=1 Tax=Leucobacter chromiisoli TaxID=2796471 RepID=A0A934Q5U3_9MICO|nr:DUF5684 domain-containing protein [Leucobacter chromiisoli]MBK0417601.1 FHA domain-containing protein [Leucobacter chromiisoli]